MKKQLLALLIAVATITAVYGACYIEGFCKCISIGQCYGQCTPNNCQTPTCIIADETTSTWNICSGSGSYTGRQQWGLTTCWVARCRIYNNCNGQYEAPPCGCPFNVPFYFGTGSNCQ